MTIGKIQVMNKGSLLGCTRSPAHVIIGSIEHFFSKFQAMNSEIFSVQSYLGAGNNF